MTGPTALSEMPKFVRIDLPPSLTSETALFVSAGFPAGVLAPLGFECSNIDGPNGHGIAVWSKGLKPGKSRENAREFVNVRVAYGSKSGRCEAATVLGPLFPAARAFVADVESKHLCGSDAFQTAPPKGEQLEYLSDRLVRFMDPPFKQGTGTTNPTDRPVQGAVEMHVGNFDAVTFRSRFASERQHLAAALVNYFLSQSPLCNSSSFRPCTGAPVAVRASGPLSASVALSSPGKTYVPMVRQGGVFSIPVTINGKMSLHFTIDSGAAHVSIPADVVSKLMQTGTLTNADILGTKKYKLADGRAVDQRAFRIRSLQVGNKIVENVVGTEAAAQSPLLLGQSFLTRFKSWSIDNQTHALALE